MGCFSYICVECGNPIFADKYGNCIGERVRLARLVNGKVVEWMKGKYNSYGRVHINRNSKHFIIKEGEEVECKDHKENIEDVHEWKSAEWNEMVDEQFNSNNNDGIIAIHEKCWKGNFGSCQSMDDKDQGWRDYTKDYTECYKCHKKSMVLFLKDNNFVCKECEMTPLQRIVKDKMENGNAKSCR